MRTNEINGMDRFAYGSIHWDEDASSSSAGRVHIGVCRHAISNIRNQYTGCTEGGGEGCIPRCNVCACTRDVYTTVMRFNIDQLYMPLGFGEEAVRLYLEATGDNNEGKQVTMGLSLRAQLCMVKWSVAGSGSVFSRGRINGIGNRFVRWNFYEYCY